MSHPGSIDSGLTQRDRVRGTSESEAPVLISIKDVSVEYKTPYGWMQAVRNSTMEIRRGEAVALIGESGSGKSTLGFALLRMLPRSARVSSGSAVFHDPDGTQYDLFQLSDKEFRDFRWSKCAMTFQAAQNVLNPVMRVSHIFYETAKAHGWNDRKAIKAKSLDLFEKVQLDPDRVFDSYPHELSGGMRQRVSIALSLLLDPHLLILDEPTTALDIITQRAIIDVIKSLREQLDFTMIFISHDLSLAAELADRVATMYAGEIVEYAPVRDSFYDPHHPYTVGLLNAVPPIAGEEFTPLVAIPGATPNLLNIPSGCPFHPRCPFATEICSEVNPPLEDIGGTHFTACHHHDQVTRDQEVWERMEDTVVAK